MKWPGIVSLSLSIAAAHGMLNRTSSTEHIIELVLEVLGAEGVYEEEVDALEAWLGTLNTEQKDILIDGEEEEMTTLVAESPACALGEAHVGGLIEDIYTALEEKA